MSKFSIKLDEFTAVAGFSKLIGQEFNITSMSEGKPWTPEKSDPINKVDIVTDKGTFGAMHYMFRISVMEDGSPIPLTDDFFNVALPQKVQVLSKIGSKGKPIPYFKFSEAKEADFAS